MEEKWKLCKKEPAVWAGSIQDSLLFSILIVRLIKL